MNRYLFEQKNSYDEASAFLENLISMYPFRAYFILGGVNGNEGRIFSTVGKYDNEGTPRKVSSYGGSTMG